jgi:hypothetical protein
VICDVIFKGSIACVANLSRVLHCSIDLLYLFIGLCTKLQASHLQVCRNNMWTVYILSPSFSRSCHEFTCSVEKKLLSTTNVNNVLYYKYSLQSPVPLVNSYAQVQYVHINIL